MPRVEVTAKHHDLRLELRIGAGNLGDDVEALDGVDLPDREAQRKRDRLLLVEQADDAAVVLPGNDEARIDRMPDVIVEAVSPDVFGDAARRDQRGDAFLREELVDLLLFGERLDEFVLFVPVGPRRCRHACRRRIELSLHLLQVIVGLALGFRLESDVADLRTPVHDDGAAQFAAVLVEVVL